MQSQKLSRILFITVIVFLSILIVMIASSKTSALDGSEFKSGRIIDDNIFKNSSSMSVSDIQSFLESRVPVCDTNGDAPFAGTTRADYGTSRGYPPLYTCLKDYVQESTSFPSQINLCDEYIGGLKTAAEIIGDVAGACGINPQVLIVLLEKEQGLVTDDWPWATQYERATGYACPENQQCNPDFLGFSNQVYNAARQFKLYELNPHNFAFKSGLENFIPYHPNTSCGGSSVFIENQATASLYNYTPYQPNQAALNNLYGTGDSCSAYGNRNFWRIFNDWFGPTISNQISINFTIKVGDELVDGPVRYYDLLKLEWEAQNADNCNLYASDGSVAGDENNTNGISYLLARETTTYTVTCSSSTDSESSSITVEVLPKPEVDLTANGEDFLEIEYGDTIAFSWNGTNNDSCNIDNKSVSPSGTEDVIAYESRLYMIICNGTNGYTDDSLFVYVKAPTFNYLENFLMELENKDGKDSVNTKKIQAKVKLTEKKFSTNKTPEPESTLLETVAFIDELAAKNKITIEQSELYSAAVNGLIDSLNYRVDISQDGCEVTAIGLPDSTVEIGVAHESFRKGAGLFNGLMPSSGIISVQTGGPLDWYSSGVIKDIDGNVLAENYKLITSDSCPPFLEPVI